jgi:acyl-CoA hydrolase
MKVTEMLPSGELNEWLEAKFTFVARDAKTNKATNIVPLLVTSDEEKALFKRGQDAANRKKELRASRAATSAYSLEIVRATNTLP